MNEMIQVAERNFASASRCRRDGQVAAVLKSLGMDVKTGEGDGKEDADPKK